MESCKQSKDLLLVFGFNANAVVADADFHPIAEVLGRSGQRRFVVAAVELRLALGRGIEAVGDQVEQNPGNLLREQINLAGGRIEGPRQRDVEALLLSPRPVIGENEALLHESVEIDSPVLS